MKILIPLYLIISTVLLNPGTGIVENFNTLSAWTPLTFPKIKRHTRYSIRRDEKLSYLKTETDNSASGLLYSREFNIFKTPVIRWRWKINNVYKKGDGTRKSGEDYPIRIYILFKYNPDDAGFSQRVKYNTIKLIYGRYPPHSSISYVWANRTHSADVFASPYSDRSKIIIKQKGKSNIGKWMSEKVNILEDYIRVFGEKPPETAGLAIMSDSDNTGESGMAYIDYIRVSGN
jgi:hypothetical protein